MNTSFALTTCAVVGMLIGNLAVMADRSQRDFKNEVVAKNTTTDEIVVNNTADVVTETEVYRMKCTKIEDRICLTYSIVRVTKE